MLNLLHLFIINQFHHKIKFITTLFQVYIQELIHKTLMKIFMVLTKFLLLQNMKTKIKLMNHRDKYAINKKSKTYQIRTQEVIHFLQRSYHQLINNGMKTTLQFLIFRQIISHSEMVKTSSKVAIKLIIKLPQLLPRICTNQDLKNSFNLLFNLKFNAKTVII